MLSIPLQFLLLLTLLPPSSASISDEQTSALLSFKRSISPDPTSFLSSWSPSIPTCAWPGVTCDSRGTHVTSLRLPSLSLSGRLPSAISGRLPRLNLLDLSRNNLTGPLPRQLLSSCANLEALILSQNLLEGEVPAEIGLLSRLRVLDLSGNFLTGRIPPEISGCANLEALVLERNILEGEVPAEIGQLARLRLLDLSRNSLTGRVPRQLSLCRNLSILVLTNVDDSDSDSNSYEEFNAFIGGLPMEIMEIPGLEILWVPRANLRFRFPLDGGKSKCNLRFLNLGRNYISGDLPYWLGFCMQLELLDLSSNYLTGSVPGSLRIGCMIYFNISRNSLSGPITLNLPAKGNCAKSKFLEGQNENIYVPYYYRLLGGDKYYGSITTVLHDFSWNGFNGSLPRLKLGFESNFSYGLFLDNNGFNGSIPGDFFRFCHCKKGIDFAVNLSSNFLSDGLNFISNCMKLKSFEAANNRFYKSIPSEIGNLNQLQNLNLRGNNLSGEIPSQIGNLVSLSVLDLSVNSILGKIPGNLANLPSLQSLLLDRNNLFGDIPPNLTFLANLTTLDLSFNNLSGEIPFFKIHPINCKFFSGNPFLDPCINNPNTSAPFTLSPPAEISRLGKKTYKLKSLIMIILLSVFSVMSILLTLFLFVLCMRKRRRKKMRIASLRKEILVTFTDTPLELTYENVVRSTSNFSVQNLIGSGGFGSTYKAEPVPGFTVAVKRLAMNRLLGLKQFETEIKTLGQIRHRNLVTLIGYHFSESDTFLIYNYLPGGNLETFIRNPNPNPNWLQISRIALDVAQALCYLHYSCVPRIVHRDIKPSNILLDSKLNAYLSDFGLAKLLEVSETHATTDVAGTFGYVAPEYATTCRVSDKSDVYSYGVVLLELVSGKRSLDPSFSEFNDGFTLVKWGRMLLSRGEECNFFPEKLWEVGPTEKMVEVLKLGLLCTDDELSVRPTMKGVVSVLKQLRN